MNTEFRYGEHLHRFGDSAAHPIEPRCDTLAALQAGSMLPEFPAPPLPTHRITAHSGAPNGRF